MHGEEKKWWTNSVKNIALRLLYTSSDSVLLLMSRGKFIGVEIVLCIKSWGGWLYFVFILFLLTFFFFLKFYKKWKKELIKIEIYYWLKLVLRSYNLWLELFKVFFWLRMTFFLINDLNQTFVLNFYSINLIIFNICLNWIIF